MSNRCSAKTCKGTRCKKKIQESSATKYCFMHDPDIKCSICKNQTSSFNKRYTLKKCGHKFCKECLANNFLEKQWLPNFNTDNHILCPECQDPVIDEDWTSITDYLCNEKKLSRKILYVTYMCPQIYLELKDFIELNREYNNKEVNKIHYEYNGRDYYLRKELPMNRKSVDIVYFNLFRGNNSCDETYYKFMFGDKEIKKKMYDEVTKELIEYVFHPSRIKNIEDLDDM